MVDNYRTKQQLLNELAVLRRRITEFEKSEVERKQMEEALRQRERLYRAIGESINYGVWVCAPDGRNIYASESFLKMVGLTQEECSNFGWGNVLHPDNAERTIAELKECVRTSGYYANTVGQYGNEKVIKEHVREQGRTYHQIHRGQLTLFERFA